MDIAQPSAPRKRRIAWGLVIAIVLYVGLRTLVLLTNFEDVVMPMFELYPMGTMAELALRDVHFPVRLYYDNAAGQLVIGQLTIPFFAVFGPSYMVLKCVPATLGLATLVLLWLLLDRHFSRFAANLGAILFAVAPSTLVRYSVVCSGNHFENLFFTTLFLWLFYRHHGTLRTSRSLFLAAFGAGLAIFVFLGSLIPVGLCAAMHLGLRGWRNTLRDAPVAIAGFAIGIAPLVVINAMTSARGLSFLSAKFVVSKPGPVSATDIWVRATVVADVLCAIGIGAAVVSIAARWNAATAGRRPSRIVTWLPPILLVAAALAFWRATSLRGAALGTPAWDAASGVVSLCGAALLLWIVCAGLWRRPELVRVAVVADAAAVVSFVAMLMTNAGLRALIYPPLKWVPTDRTAEFLGGRLVEAGMFEPAFGLTRVQWGFVFVAAFAVAYVVSIPSVSRSVRELVVGLFRYSGASACDAAAFERAKLVPFVLYVPLAAIAFGISNMRLGGYVNNMEAGGYRYYLPTLLFALLLAAVWTARWWQRGGVARAGAVLVGGTFLACGATSLTLPDWTFREVGNGHLYEGYNLAQMSRGLVSGKNGLSTEEVVHRVGQWPPDVRERVIRAIGFNVGYRDVDRAFHDADHTAPLVLEGILAGYPADWRPLLANGVGSAVRYQTRMQARTGDLPKLLRNVQTPDGELYDEVVAGSASTNVSLVFGWEVRDTFSEDTELMTMDTPSMGAFERGCGLWFARLKQRGVPHEVKMVEDFRQKFGKPTFLEGWRRGEEGLEH